MRNDFSQLDLNRTALVLGESVVPPDPGQGWIAFGWGDLPGANIVIDAFLPGDFFHEDPEVYQAKDILHELGHNLGLCHIDEEGQDRCAALTGRVPDDEAFSRFTVMATPPSWVNFDAALGIPPDLVNAFAIPPATYSPWQWQHLLVDGVRQR